MLLNLFSCVYCLGKTQKKGDPKAEAWKYFYSGADRSPDAQFTPSKNADLDVVGWYDSRATAGDNGETTLTDPLGAPEPEEVRKRSRVRRGGYWGGSATNCSVYYRAHAEPNSDLSNPGIRLVRSVK